VLTRRRSASKRRGIVLIRLTLAASFVACAHHGLVQSADNPKAARSPTICAAARRQQLYDSIKDNSVQTRLDRSYVDPCLVVSSDRCACDQDSPSKFFQVTCEDADTGAVLFIGIPRDARRDPRRRARGERAYRLTALELRRGNAAHGTLPGTPGRGGGARASAGGWGSGVAMVEILSIHTRRAQCLWS
jgi:hypothetical protein